MTMTKVREALAELHPPAVGPDIVCRECDYAGPSCGRADVCPVCVASGFVGDESGTPLEGSLATIWQVRLADVLGRIMELANE